MRISYTFIVTIWIGILCMSCKTGENEPPTYTIFAAAGMRQVTDEICDAFEIKENCKIQRNYASSGMLARQIENGAKADVYISANKVWTDYLINQKILIDSTVRILARTNLVAIAPFEKAGVNIEFKPEFDISKAVPNHIAIGDPAHVPVGSYTEQVLKAMDWLPRLNNNMLLARDVSSILRYVELGECDWGIVYYTEAIKSKKVDIIAEIPPELHDPVMFYIGNVNQAQSGSHGLNAFFSSDKGQEILVRNGFRSFHSIPESKTK